MAVNKNFVVKNGVEVATDLIYAETGINKVGLGTTTPGAKLHVIGNIVGAGLTLSGSIDAGNVSFTGIATVNDGLYVGAGGTALHVDVGSNTIGINSSSPDSNYSLDVQPGAGQSAATLGGSLDVQGNTWINGDLSVNGAIDGSFTVSLDNPTITGVVTANNREIFTQFDIINNSNVAYQYQSTGIGFTQNTDNPTLFLNRGEKYHFNLNASGHPFYIKTAPTTGLGDQYEDGVDGQGTQVGVVTFYVPFNAPNEVYYQCGSHSGMGNTMYVLKEQSPQAVELNITNLEVSGLSTFVGVSTFSSTANFGAATGAKFWDNKKLVFGEDDDLEIYHDGTDAYLDNDTGHLYIRNNVAADVGGNIYLRPHDDEEGIIINDDGNVELYYDNSKKFETTNEGILVTGIATATTLVGGGQTINATGIDITGIVTATSFVGNVTGDVTGNADTATTATNVTVADESSDTSCNVLFVTAATGNLPPKSGTNLTFNSSTGTLTATEFSGGGSNLTSVNATTLDSIDSGSFLRSDAADTKTSGDLTFNDSIKANFGTGSDLQIYHDGSNSYIQDSGTGAIKVKGDDIRIENAAGRNILKGTSTATELYFDNGSSSSKKLETTSTGITVTGDVNSTSDINLKKDIEVVTSATEILNQLRGVKFTWKQNDEKSLGVIAQEVEAILPELVKGEEGDKSVNYSGLIGVLIESVKELSARVEELENR